ncbi:MAG: ankyrin repeat domain-containing protein [Terracidiphilus sp.]|jgi:ankyrin repeat protein
MKFKLFFAAALALSLSLVYVFGFRQDSQQLRASLISTISGSRAEAATRPLGVGSALDDKQASLNTTFDTDNAAAATSLNKLGSESEVLRASLIKAVRSDNTELAKKLVKLGADVNSRTSPNGWSALHYAVRNGNAEIVQILLKAGADPNYQGTMEGQQSSAGSLRPLVLGQAALDLVNQVPASDIEETLRQNGLDDPALVKSMKDPNATDRYKKVVDVLTRVTKES